jgi:hypothetical protein
VFLPYNRLVAIPACESFPEYQKLLDVVSSYDSRLLTIKGWSVTVSLVLIAQGFEKKNRSLFLVAALSAMCFWLLDAQFKGFQMRYYPRMREIEVTCQGTGWPRVDWSWYNAPAQFEDQASEIKMAPRLYTKFEAYTWRYFLPGVLLPHIFPMLIGALLALMVRYGKLGEFVDPPHILKS